MIRSLDFYHEKALELFPFSIVTSPFLMDGYMDGHMHRMREWCEETVGGPRAAWSCDNNAYGEGCWTSWFPFGGDDKAVFYFQDNITAVAFKMIYG